MKKKVREITHPSTNSMSLPPMKYKLKKGNKKSKKDHESDVNYDPSHWEYAKGSQGSQSIKRSCTKPTKSELCRQSSKHLYLSQFPDFLHRYTSDIIDMGKDGNYGFRAIVALLGWDEESRSLVRIQIDIEFYQHRQIYPNVFYGTLL